MNTFLLFLSFMPIIIAGIIVLLGGILIISHDKEPSLKTSHGRSTRKKRH